MPISENDGKGNMYPWVNFMHTHHRGRCPHECGYCYASSGRAGEHYSGPVRFVEKELKASYARPGVYFLEHMFDLFADHVPDDSIRLVLAHAVSFPDNTYVLQTKNPERMGNFFAQMPAKRILGTTIESNRWHEGAMGRTPLPESRLEAFENVCFVTPATPHYVTIEPVLRFDLDILVGWLAWLRPTFVNIGAATKGHHLDEPTYDEVLELWRMLRADGIEVRLKSNLNRLREVPPR